MSDPQPHQSRFVDRGPLRLHHLVWGDPNRHPVVLLHGIRLHAHVWGDFCRREAHRRHLLALDLRGHGDSAWAPEGHYHLHEYYEDLVAVLDSQGLERVTLIGHSLGARVAMLFAHLHPERVARLVLVDMGAGLPPTLGVRDFSRVTETAPPADFSSPEQALDYLSGILRLAPRAMLEESVRHGLRLTPKGRYHWKYDPALSGPPQPRPGTREWDLWEAVATITCPTLLLRGEHSRVVTPEIAQRMGETMHRCRVIEVPAAGHALFTDQPDFFAREVTQFLDITRHLENAPASEGVPLP